ncbi:MAG TPA: D-alanine--D-alanine ligase, partial [Candidatus Brocadiia bacterium]|nr:D-alanine--D-alanine ligase [Candidatus Brocadiia bacterium]
GREFTVGVAGEGEEAAALGAMEVVLLKGAERGGYGFFNKKHFEDVVEYRPAKAEEDPLAAEAAEVSVAAWRALGCRDAGRVDVRCNREGRAQFIEVNPLAGLNPVISDLPILCRMNGISYVELIGRIVASASRRVRR